MSLIDTVIVRLLMSLLGFSQKKKLTLGFCESTPGSTFAWDPCSRFTRGKKRKIPLTTISEIPR